MTDVDFEQLVTMPERDFVAAAWASFDPVSVPGDETQILVRMALVAGQSRKVMLLRIWSAVRERTGRGTSVHLKGGRLARAANIAQRFPAGLPLLAFLLGQADFLSGRQHRRRMLRQLEALRIQERLLAEFEEMQRRLAGVGHEFTRVDDALARLEGGLDRLASELGGRIDRQEALGDDLTRRVDMMTFEARQALDSAALGLAEKKVLVDRIEAGIRRPA